MDVVWDMATAVTGRDVLERLVRRRPLAYTMAMTVMDNLHRKGILRPDQGPVEVTTPCGPTALAAKGANSPGQRFVPSHSCPGPEVAV